MVTAPCEGACWSLAKDGSAPIRLYSDRWIEDDIGTKYGLPKKRQRLCKSRYRQVRRAAKQNDMVRA